MNSASAVLQGFSITGHGWTVAALILAMATACLFCAVDLWTRATERAWVLVAVMNLAMIGVHLPMSAHQHGAMAAATALAVVAVLLATVVLGVRSRGYAPRVPDAT